MVSTTLNFSAEYPPNIRLSENSVSVIRVRVKYIFSGTHYTLPEIRYYYLLLKDTNDWRAEDQSNDQKTGYRETIKLLWRSPALKLSVALSNLNKSDIGQETESK